MNRRRVLRILRPVVGLGLAAVAVVVLLDHRGELSGASGSLRHIRASWLIPGALVEAVSVLCFSRILGRLLIEARSPLTIKSLLALTLASNAVANSLPAGPAFGAAYSYRQMRIRQVPEMVAVWALLAAGILAGSALALLASVGVAVALGQGSALNLVGVTFATLLLASMLMALLRRPQVVVGPVGMAVTVARVVAHRPRAEPSQVVAGLRWRLAAVTPSWWGLIASLGWALGNWTFDLACLLCAFGAVGAPIPWRGVILAYGAAQLASNLPITPGGLGVVEGSLTIGLIAYGGVRASSVAAVIIYRVLSFWLPLLLGWSVAGALALRARRGRRERTPVGNPLYAGPVR